MVSKKALALVAVLALGFIAMAPAADLTAADEEDMLIPPTSESPEDTIFITPNQPDNNFFYDCIIVLIIALIAAGALHVKAHKK